MESRELRDYHAIDRVSTISHSKLNLLSHTSILPLAYHLKYHLNHPFSTYESKTQKFQTQVLQNLELENIGFRRNPYTKIVSLHLIHPPHAANKILGIEIAQWVCGGSDITLFPMLQTLGAALKYWVEAMDDNEEELCGYNECAGKEFLFELFVTQKSREILYVFMRRKVNDDEKNSYDKKTRSLDS